VSDADPGAQGRRRSKEQVRETMLQTALEMAVEAGVGISLDSISVEEVIQNARVPRSSVYRIWPAKEMFVDDLLCHMAGRHSYFSGQDVFDPATFAVVTATIRDNKHLLGSAQGRRAVLCEGVRLAVQRNVQALRQNSNARIHTALIATVSSTGSAAIRPRIAQALDDAEAASRRSIVALFRDLVMPTLGLRLRDPGATLDHLAVAGSALAQGLALRHVLVDALAKDGADGAPEPGADGDGGSARLLDCPVPGPGLARPARRVEPGRAVLPGTDRRLPRARSRLRRRVARLLAVSAGRGRLGAFPGSCFPSASCPPGCSRPGERPPQMARLLRAD
jgi:AcrR family transcriptional regulator